MSETLNVVTSTVVNLSGQNNLTLECGQMLNVMTALPNIGGALCWTPQSLPDAHYSTTRVLCSNAANIGERKTWMQSECCTWQNSVTGQELPNILYQPRRQTSCKVWLASVQRRRCGDEAKTWNPFKFAGVPQSNEPISVATSAEVSHIEGHVEEILVFNEFLANVNSRSRSLYAVAHPSVVCSSSVCRLSVTLVHPTYSGGCKFRQFFYGV